MNYKLVQHVDINCKCDDTAMVGYDHCRTRCSLQLFMPTDEYTLFVLSGKSFGHSGWSNVGGGYPYDVTIVDLMHFYVINSLLRQSVRYAIKPTPCRLKKRKANITQTVHKATLPTYG